MDPIDSERGYSRDPGELANAVLDDDPDQDTDAR